MPGTKRTSDGDAPTTRASKAAKTDSDSPPKGGKGKKAAAKKAAPMKNKEFSDSALPLHLNLTHTPPSSENKSASQEDPGFINTLTLLPSTFTTGSYGWKGNRRVAIEIEKDGKKEKVQVQLTINATVVGSKNAEDAGAEDAEDKAKEDAEE